MKMLNAALVITLMLVSHVALAERGSAKDNSVTYAKVITMHQDHKTREFSPFELTD